jgi:hypothetical protein
MKSLNFPENSYLILLASWLIVLGVGCVDLTPAWEKSGRDIKSSRTGGMPATGGSTQEEMGDVGSGGIRDDVKKRSGGTTLDGSGESQSSSESIENGGNSGSTTGGMGSGGSTTGGIGSGGSANGGTSSGGSANGGMSSGGMISGGTNGGSIGDAGGSQTCSTESKLDSGICWYFGNPGASCATTCSTHGGTSPQAASFIGTPDQGGSLAKCVQLMGLFGLSTIIIERTRTDGLGLGCHTTPTLTIFNYWLSLPNYTDTAKMNNVRLICGCLR